MPGLLDIQNNKRQLAMGQFNYLAGLDTQRQANNKQLLSSAKGQQMDAIGGGLGAMAVGAVTGNPVGIVTGGLSVLGSLF